MQILSQRRTKHAGGEQGAVHASRCGGQSRARGLPAEMAGGFLMMAALQCLGGHFCTVTLGEVPGASSMSAQPRTSISSDPLRMLGVM